jgi:hypothetical protein
MESGSLRIITHMVRSLSFFALILLSACHLKSHYPSGGYPYPKHFAAKDTNFYFYPVRDKFSRSDSIRDAFAYISYREMDEPNLSLSPMPSAVFRLTYDEVMGHGPTVIVLTRDSLIVKLGHYTDEYYKLPDTSRLDTLERRLIKLLDRHYPLDKVSTDTSMHARWRKHYLDSMGRRYPQLYDPQYYYTLMEKELAHSKPLFTYTRQSKKISDSDFHRFVNLLNASDFWHLPPECPCSDFNDSWGFTLEANTATKYNMAEQCMCDADTTRFKYACQELIRLAGLDKKIHVYHDHPYTFHTIDAADLPPPVQMEDVPPKKRRHGAH